MTDIDVFKVMQKENPEIEKKYDMKVEIFEEENKFEVKINPNKVAAFMKKYNETKEELQRVNEMQVCEMTLENQAQHHHFYADIESKVPGFKVNKLCDDLFISYLKKDEDKVLQFLHTCEIRIQDEEKILLLKNSGTDFLLKNLDLDSATIILLKFNDYYRKQNEKA